MDLSRQILSEIVIYMKYARWLPKENRRETWDEIVTRNMNMHIKKYPQLEFEIRKNYKYVYEKKVLPSGRALQFSGKPIEINCARQYNCSYVPINDWRVFSEIMFLLLSGTGVGYSVQFSHIEQLPVVRGPLKQNRRFLVGDSITGWADAVKVLMKAYFFNKSNPNFDFSDIRSKGTELVTAGGKAPGPQPLKDCIHNLRKILDTKEPGSKLTSLEIHDICCYIADAVLAGGIRRSAMISFFSYDDEDMKTCKFNDWDIKNPQRARANNSAVLLRHRIKRQDFFNLWEKIKESNSGEPGIFFSNDINELSNPCLEISLRGTISGGSFCNLTTINFSTVKSQKEFEERIAVATFIGTLQAGYTNFHYLRDGWIKNTIKDALLGVSMTGLATTQLDYIDFTKGAIIAKKENERIAKLIGINKAARIGCIKPEGTASLILGTSSGIHAWHAPYYIRRLRVGKDEKIYKYLLKYNPELIEDDFFKPHLQAVISVPIKAPKGAITRKESPIELLTRVKKISTDWIKNSHIRGQNTHNVSCTVPIKNTEWNEIGNWMWDNKIYYNGLSVLPYDGGSYKQAPFEEITKDQYEKMYTKLTQIDLTKVVEIEDTTSHRESIACGGGSCTLTSI